ncbi:MAG: tetratricopeptide repeat protein, partial [Bdellovibrionales bacterium]|nr:tetratricopeptide repeat protein [Bdellovibrionales bacterium]
MLSHEVISEDILIRSTRSDQLLELAQLHFERLNFDQAITFAIAGGNQFLKESRFQDFLKCVNIRIRIAAERSDQESVGKIKDELQELLILQGIQLSSSTHYSFALCAYLKGQHESAEKYLQKAIELARTENSEDDLIRAKIAMSSIFKAKGRPEDAEKELLSIRDIPLYWKRPDYRLNAKIIQIGLLLLKKDPVGALALSESCLEDLKFHQSVYLKTFQLYNSGRVHKELGNLELAKTYLNLAKSSI